MRFAQVPSVFVELGYFPMSLFQAWEQLWAALSKSLQEQLSTMMADENSLIDALFARFGVQLPEKVPKTQVLERLVL